GRAPGTRGARSRSWRRLPRTLGSPPRGSHGPDGRSRPRPSATLAAVAASRPTGPHVDLVSIELVRDIAPLLQRGSQRLPVVTESVIPGGVSCHRYDPYSKRGTIPISSWIYCNCGVRTPGIPASN